MKSIIWTLFKIIFVILIFSAGYIFAHEGLTIPPLNTAIDKVGNFCTVKPTVTTVKPQ